MGISTPRQLPMQHMARAIEKASGPGPDPPLLGPDEMQLYSYYRPGLSAGAYEVSVVQEITAKIPSEHAKQQKLVVTNVRNASANSNVIVEEPQRFEVVVPRFTLDPKLINSYYPPDGHQDEGRILPHIVLNDPHYPWEIAAGSTTNMSGPIDGDRNMVPWIGLVVFDPAELHLADLENDIKPLRIPGVTDVNQQVVNGTFPMAVKDYFSELTGIPKSSRVDIETGFGKNGDPGKELIKRIKESTDMAKVIFPTKKLYKEMFSDCESMKYLAHVRNINTIGFPDAGIEQLGLYSVIVSSRTGRFDITKPTTQVCHLVSIENFDSTKDGIEKWLNTPKEERTGSDRIGIFSLYSWVYTALPPDPVNFVDTVENLVRHQQMLRADQPTLDAIKRGLDDMQKRLDDKKNGIENTNESPQDMVPGSTKAKASQVLLDRLSAGYTFARWRCETGEEATALNRGPLVPLRQPPKPALDLPDCSNTSKDFQILDKDTGLMDLSYSNAWQLGKTLAISDTVFSAAMLRFRSTLHNTSASITRATLNRMLPKEQLLKSLSVSLKRANDLSSGTPGQPERLRSKLPAPPVSDVTEDEAKPVFKRNLAAGVQSHSLAGATPFNGLNPEPANDNDWVTIHNWMADKLFLADIPPHYLIPEASFVLPEGIRFFYVDDFWLDCLLDGALSVANHLDHDDDVLRVQVKERFNSYLQAKVPKTGIKPQIPCYGFILRSKIVKTMPDLRITVKWKVPDDRHPVCRYTRFDDTTLICLLDRQPQELDYIELAQPAHQQRFSLGYNLTGPTKSNDGKSIPGRLEFKLRKLYTKDAPSGEWNMSTKQPHEEKKEEDADKDTTKMWYNWDTRCIQLRTMMTDMTELLQRDAQPEDLTTTPPTPFDGEYKDGVPNSCALGIELNDPSYYFVIRPPKTETSPVIVPRDRKLYINKDANAFSPPLAKKPVAMKLKPKTTSPPISQPLAMSSTTQDLSNIPPPGQAPHIQCKTRPFPPSLLALRKASTPAPTPPSPSISTLTSPSTPSPLTSLATPPPPPFTQLQSQFTLTIYADYKPFPSSPTRTKDGFDPQAYLPTKNIYLYDLIFSLRKNTTNLTSSYPLLELQIDIPTEGIAPPENKETTKEPLIKQGYAGSGVKMISNQRFVPLLYTDAEAGFLRVRVIPRTAEDSYRFVIGDNKSKELSFRLAEAEVTRVKNGQFVSMIGGRGKTEWRGVSTVKMVEIYAVGEEKSGAGVAGQQTWPVTTVVEVVKNAVRDEEDVRMEKGEGEDVGRG